MFQGTEILFVSASPQLLEAAQSEGLQPLDLEKAAAQPPKEAE
jgi:methionine salvage enolase-phosphatase E1